MAFLNTVFSIANPGDSLAEGLLDQKGFKYPVIFSLAPSLIVFVVHELSSWQAGGMSEKSRNTTPFGQIKDLSFHMPSSVTLEGYVLKNPASQGDVSKALEQAALGLSLGAEVVRLFATGNFSTNLLAFDSYSQAMGQATTLSDNNSPIHLWNFPASFDYLFYSNLLTHSVWTLQDFNFSDGGTFDSIEFRMKFVEQVIPVEGAGGVVRRFVDATLI